MRKLAISALALLALPALALAQTAPSPLNGVLTPNTVAIGTTGISGIQLQGGLSVNGQTDFVGGVQPGMVESGSSSVYTTDTAALSAPSLTNITATTTGVTTGSQTSSITDTNIAAGQTGWTSNDVFGESTTDAGLYTSVPSLSSGSSVGWDK